MSLKYEPSSEPLHLCECHACTHVPGLQYELALTLGTLSPRGGPVQDPVLTPCGGRRAVNSIVSDPQIKFVKQLVLVKIVKLRDFKTPIPLKKTLCFKFCTKASCFTNLISGSVPRRLVFKAHRLCVSLNSRLESNKEEEVCFCEICQASNCELQLQRASSSSLLLSSLELSDTKVYEP